jgi:hypothetical protein
VRRVRRVRWKGGWGVCCGVVPCAGEWSGRREDGTAGMAGAAGIGGSAATIFAGRAPLTAPCVRRAGIHAHARGLLGSQVCRRAGARRWRGKKKRRHDAQRGAMGEDGVG